jgi:hypothetical protein
MNKANKRGLGSATTIRQRRVRHFIMRTETRTGATMMRERRAGKRYEHA